MKKVNEIDDDCVDEFVCGYVNGRAGKISRKQIYKKSLTNDNVYDSVCADGFWIDVWMNCRIEF